MKKLLYILLLAASLYHISLYSQWVQQTVPVTKQITGIKFINPNKGWALSSLTSAIDTCHILYTSNGGTNWIIQFTNTNSMYLGLSVVDSNIIYAGGISSGATANLTKTTNGGLNWFVIPTPTNMSILDMQFLNKDSGWTVGGAVGPDVRTTTNGGLNWIVRTSGILAQTQVIYFINYNTGFCGGNSLLYKTTNAGVNWIQIANFLRQATSIYFFNENAGWVGATISTFYKTTNGGVNWDTIALTPSIFGSITDIKFLSPTLAYGGNRTLRLLISTNGGMNWGYQSNVTAAYKLSFTDTLTGWIGDNGISKTTNGGGIIIPVGLNNISGVVPHKFRLYQNYPNPFNPTTNIKYHIPQTTFVKLIVYDVLGSHIETLIEQKHTAGTYIADWDASEYSSGIYFYTLLSENYTETKKMLLVK